MKRICVLFAFLLAAFTSFAQDDVVIVKVEGIAYEIDDATKTAIVGLNSDWGPDGEPFGGVSGVVKIPKHISFEGKKYKVTGIKELAFFNCFDLTSVELPSTVTSIPEGAFLHCVSLTAIDIPKSVTSIDNNAFHGSGLTSMVLPKSVTSIGDRAFANCEKLAYVFIPKSVTSIGEVAFQNSAISTLMVDDHNPNYCAVDNVLFNKAQTELIYCPTSREGAYDVPSTVRMICDEAFYECEHLTEVAMPNSVKEIGHDAFYGCDRLSAVHLSDSLTTIGSQAFASCSYLQSIKLPATLKSLGAYAFRSTGLTKIELPASLAELESYLFADCSALTSVVIPGSVTKIGKSVFEDNSRLAFISIPSSVAHIESDAFKNCTALRKVEIDAPRLLASDFRSDESVATIFGNQIEEYIVGNSVSRIGSNAFRNCEALRTVALPDALTSIADGTFSGCKQLFSVAIPASVTSIGQSAFSNCSSLLAVEFPSALTSIGQAAFSDCSSLAEVELPAALTTIGKEAFASCRNLASVAFPSALTSIGVDAFSGCCALRSVVLPQSVTRIDAGAFSACKSLTSIEFPASLTTVADNLLDHCTCLTTVVLPSSVTHIGTSAFEECRNLASLALPASLTSIGDYAFNGCNSLSAVAIPASVSSVGHMAFPLHIYKNSRPVITHNFFGLTLGVTTKQEAISKLLEQGVKLTSNSKKYLVSEDVKFDGNHYDAVHFSFYKGILQQIGFSDSGESGFSSSKRASLSKQYTKQYGPYKNYFFESEGDFFTDDVTRLLITESSLIFVDEALSTQSNKDDAARFREIRPFAATRISKTVLDCTLGVSTKDEVIATFAAKGMSVVQEALPDSIVFSGVTHEGVDFKAVTAKFFAGKLMELDFSNLAKALPNSDFETLKATFQKRYAAYDMSIGLDGLDVDHAAYSDDAVTLSLNRQNGLFYQDAELGNQYFESLMASLRGKRKIEPDKQHFVDLFLQVSKSGK